MIEGQVLSENTAMLAMCRELGFEIAHDPNTCDVKVAIDHQARRDVTTSSPSWSSSAPLRLSA